MHNPAVHSTMATRRRRPPVAVALRDDEEEGDLPLVPRSANANAGLSVGHPIDPRVPVRSGVRSAALSAAVLFGLLPLLGGLVGCFILWLRGLGARPIVNLLYSAWNTHVYVSQGVRLIGYAAAGLWCNSFFYLPLGIFLHSVRDFFHRIDRHARSPVTLAIKWTETVALVFGWTLVLVFVYDAFRYGVNPRKPLLRLGRRLYRDAYRLVRCQRASGGRVVCVLVQAPTPA